jgi:hypothetical protein
VALLTFAVEHGHPITVHDSPDLAAFQVAHPLAVVHPFLEVPPTILCGGQDLLLASRTPNTLDADLFAATSGHATVASNSHSSKSFFLRSSAFLQVAGPPPVAAPHAAATSFASCLVVPGWQFPAGILLKSIHIALIQRVLMGHPFLWGGLIPLVSLIPLPVLGGNFLYIHKWFPLLLVPLGWDFPHQTLWHSTRGLTISLALFPTTSLPMSMMALICLVGIPMRLHLWCLCLHLWLHCCIFCPMGISPPLWHQMSQRLFGCFLLGQFLLLWLFLLPHWIVCLHLLCLTSQRRAFVLLKPSNFPRSRTPRHIWISKTSLSTNFVFLNILPNVWMMFSSMTLPTLWPVLFGMATFVL